MQIRPMKLEDIEQVVAMENKTWDNFNTPASYQPQINIKSFKPFRIIHIISLLKKMGVFWVFLIIMLTILSLAHVTW